MALGRRVSQVQGGRVTRLVAAPRGDVYQPPAWQRPSGVASAHAGARDHPGRARRPRSRLFILDCPVAAVQAALAAHRCAQVCAAAPCPIGGMGRLQAVEGRKVLITWVRCVAGQGAAQGAYGRGSSRVKKNVAPCSTAASAQMRPPCRWIMRCTVASPMPVPSYSAALCSRWKGLKSLAA